MRRQLPYKKVITLVVLVAASIFLLSLAGKTDGGPSLWQSMFLKLSKPVFQTADKVGAKWRSWTALLADKADLEEENKRLSQETETVEYLRALVEELRRKNAAYRGLLGFKDDSEDQYLVAEIVGRNPVKWFSTVAISLGEADGIEVDSPVVSGSGLVGRTLSVDKEISTVVLITDPESGVGVMLERSRDFGVLLGTGDPESLVLRLFDKDADVAPGDKVLTSGVGSKFPPGIFVGEVQSVYIPRPGLVKEAVIHPAADLQHLEEVLVMMR